MFEIFFSSLQLDSGVAAVAVDDYRQILAGGYEDSSCLLYDLRERKTIQIYQPHSDQIRSVRFSMDSRYLLTASYDHQAVITYLTGK